MKAKYIIIAVIAIFFFSCEKSLVYIEEQFEPRVVANCIMQPDSTFSISFSMSKSVLDEHREIIVPNADIKLFEDGNNVLEIYNYGEDSSIDFKPITGASYQLEINSKNKELFASTKIPLKINIESIDTAYVQHDNPYYWSVKKALEVSVNIDDPKNEKNYYRILIRQRYYQRDPFTNYGDTSYIYQNVLLRPEFYDAVLGKNTNENNPFNIDEIRNRFSVFDDQLFDGSAKKIKFIVNYFRNSYSYSNVTEPYGSLKNPYTGKDTILNDVKLDISLWSLSEEAYLYYKSRNAYDSTYGDEFVEPVPVYTNIENGLGIFMGYSVEKKTIKIDPWNFY